MTFARIVMTLALRSFPPERCDWSQAMAAEFEASVEDGRPLPFALSCLVMAWRDLPRHEHGRFLLANHALVLLAIAPMATFHLGCAVSGSRFLLHGRDHYYAMLMAGDLHQRAMAGAYRAAMPVLTALILLLGTGHMLIAWNALACHWHRVRRLWLIESLLALAMIATIALTIPSAFGMAVQLAALGLELCILPRHAGGEYRLPFSQYDKSFGSFTVRVTGENLATWAIHAGDDPALKWQSSEPRYKIITRCPAIWKLL